MSDNITIIGGDASFAYFGAPAWHGLGTAIQCTDSPDDIARKAGLTHTVNSTPVLYQTETGETREMPHQSVLYRNDNGESLGLCHPTRYKIHQPIQILEFFRDFLGDNQLSIETAGTLCGGRIVWCLAKLGSEYSFLLPGADHIDGYVRLQTSYDGTRSTSLVATTVRVVCWNTLNMCERQTKGADYRMPHTGEFNAQALQFAFGLLGEQHRITNTLWNELAKRNVSAREAMRFFMNVLEVPEDQQHDIGLLSTVRQHQLEALNDSFYSGPGAELESSRNTAFGLLQAVTHYSDHSASVRNLRGDGTGAARLYSTWFGTGADRKAKAVELLASMIDANELIQAAA